ncbi:hypothetical protein KGY73_07265 [bacterium]|nr:hypothetical protein [bacterium]
MRVEMLKHIPVKMTEKSILRRMGGKGRSKPSGRLRRKLKKAVKEIGQKAKPRAMYRILPVANKNGSIILDDQISIKSRKLKTLLGPCDKAAVFITTLGEEIDKIIHKNMKTRPHYGYILDSVASVAAESAAKYLKNHIDEKLNGQEKTTLRYSPGYCDWPVQEQRKIFQVLPSESIEVKLSGECLMSPRKSISGVLGVCAMDSQEKSENICLSCAKRECPYRRTIRKEAHV